MEHMGNIVGFTLWCHKNAMAPAGTNLPVFTRSSNDYNRDVPASHGNDYWRVDKNMIKTKR